MPLNTLVSNLVFSKQTYTHKHTQAWSTFAGANGLRNLNTTELVLEIKTHLCPRCLPTVCFEADSLNLRE